MGDYKLIVGSPGHYNGWYPPPKSEVDEPMEIPEDIAQNLARFQDEEIQLFNIKGTMIILIFYYIQVKKCDMLLREFVLKKSYKSAA